MGRLSGPPGPPGSQGPAGPAGASGGGSIIPYASGGPITMTTIAGGLVGTTGLVGFGNSVSNVTLLGGTIDLSDTTIAGPLINYAFSVPRAGTIESLAAFFSTTIDLTLIGTTVTVTAQLYRSTTPTTSLVQFQVLL
jgi:BclB C-terminal domain-containing protein